MTCDSKYTPQHEGNMTVWLTLEPLPDNDLNLPGYATPHSAGVDFSACLTRPCKHVDAHGTKTDFYVNDAGIRTKTFEIPSKPKLILPCNETVMISLGYKCEFNNGFVLQLFVRSSMGARGLMLANAVGIVDSDYRGELFACVFNRNIEPITIEHGQRIVQGVLTPCYQAIIKNDKVNETVRGTGGFGSTGH